MNTGAHAVPLAPRWLQAEIETQHAGAQSTARVSLQNDGLATWHSRGRDGLQLAYHWLDPLENPVVWDGARTPLPRAVAPGEIVVVDVALEAPRPPGSYIVRFDLVEEHRFWLEELGCATLDIALDVLPRIEARRLAVVVHGGPDAATTAALDGQLEPLVAEQPVAVAHLVAGAVPPPDWAGRLLDAHAEGWVAVGPALLPDGGGLVGRRARAALAPWAPGGRNPRLGAPLLLPSLLTGLTPDEHLGLPAYTGEDGLFEGRVAVRLPRRFGRRPP